jgi:two-component system LytT family response regulator
MGTETPQEQKSTYEYMSEKGSIKAIIVDDSLQARKLLRLMLEDLCPDVILLGEAENVAEGLVLIKTHEPDVVFLDIEMPGKSGLQMAEELIATNVSCQVVFTTAYNSYAINAFRLSAIDYLLKPIQEDQLIEAVEKIKLFATLKNSVERLGALSQNLNEEKASVLSIPIQGGFEYLSLDDIEYFEAEGSYVRIVCSNQKPKIVSKNLKYFETALESTRNFVRTHRSYLVNMNFVHSYSKSEGGVLLLKSHQNIPISRERKQGVFEYLK